MYSFILFVHNFWRWLVIAIALYAFFRSLINWQKGKTWNKKDATVGKMFAGLVDVQILLGLLLFAGVSPLMQVVFKDFSAAMKVDELRYFAVEHMPIMIVAAVFVHIGSRVDKQDIEDIQKWQRVSLWFGLANLAFLFGTPWFRPLLPF